MVVIDWNSVPMDRLRDNLELIRGGMPVSLPQLYVLPTRATTVHENFLKRLEGEKWGFILVMGENRAGKSAYLKHVQAVALQKDYCIVSIEVDEQRIKTVGTNKYFSDVFFNKLRFPDGELFAYKFGSNESFRNKVRQLLENRRADFEFYSAALTNALLFASNLADAEKMNIAKAWLRGEPQYVVDLRSVEIYDRTARSLLDVPTANLLYFMKELVSSLGFPGLLVLVDEIERVGSLPETKGRETLFVLRNLINALVSEESQAASRGILRGIFLCFAISTYYLGFGQVVEVDPVQFKARADREGRPKVLITDVPRLGLLLKQSATMIDVEVEEKDLREIAERIIGCYSHVNGQMITKKPEELCNDAIERTGGNLAGPNVQQMVKILDDLP